MASLFHKLFKSSRDKEFHEFDFKVVEFQLEKEGKVAYAQWLHPAEFSNHPGNAGHVMTQESVNFFRQYVKEGDTVLDIGAHEGDTTMPMALAAGKSGMTLAFEPNPHSFKVLEINAGLNPDKANVVPLNFAATATDGEFTFGSGDASFGNGGIVGFTHNKKRNVRFTFQVQGKNVESYIRNHHPERMARIALVKVDAEGYDKEILKSIHEIIDQYRPVVITECFGPSTTEEKAELFDILAGHGYTISVIDGFIVQQPVRIAREEMNGKKTFDLIAVPSSAKKAG